MASRTYDPRLFAWVEFILKRQVEIATQEHYRAKFECWQLGSTPGSTSEYQLPESRRKCALKQNALSLALKRLDNFIGTGTVPEDLRPPEHSGESLWGSSFA